MEKEGKSCLNRWHGKLTEKATTKQMCEGKGEGPVSVQGKHSRLRE